MTTADALPPRRRYDNRRRTPLRGGRYDNRRRTPLRGGVMTMEIVGLTVRFGGVTALDDMTVTFGSGTCGLIGANGAGKTTFFNVLSGFVRPLSGTVRALGDNLLAMPHYQRARWGLRRTFQTEQ